MEIESDPVVQERAQLTPVDSTVTAPSRVATWNTYSVDRVLRNRRSTAATLERGRLYVVSSTAFCGGLLILAQYSWTSTALDQLIIPLTFVGWISSLYWNLVRVPSRLMQDLFLPEPAVQITFSVNGCEYGMDIGQLSVEDGWLLFEGERTTFSLSQRDVRAEWDVNGFTRLRLLRRGARVRLKLEPVDQKRSAKAHLYTRVLDWLTTDPPVPGISLLPPLSPDPDRDNGRAFAKWLIVPAMIPFVLDIAGELGPAASGWAGIPIMLLWLVVFPLFLAGCSRVHRVIAYKRLSRLASRVVANG